MVAQKYRWDFIGLSTDVKPTPATSDKVVDGSTFYCSDNSKLYVYCKNNWYERKALGGGGGGGSYTAGTGITISDDTISVDTTTIQPKLTAGSNVTISEDTISATDTTYSNFTGTDGTAAGAAGLVPAPATTDAGKFLKADGTWDTAGGSVTPVQTTGTSTTDVMSQDAITKMVYPLINTVPNAINIRGTTGIDSVTGDSGIAIGASSMARGERTISIGHGARNYANGDRSVVLGNFAKTDNNSKAVAIGNSAECRAAYSVALGDSAIASRVGEVNVGAGTSGEGYNSTDYRVIGGVHDGQDNHDAATVAQGNTLATSAPTTSTVGVLGQLYTDTTNMHTYQCTAISGDTYTWTQRW